MSTYPDGRPHVMVVDDDPTMCDFLESFLAVRGYPAVTVGSADEAVRRPCGGCEPQMPGRIRVDLVHVCS